MEKIQQVFLPGKFCAFTLHTDHRCILDLWMRDQQRLQLRWCDLQTFIFDEFLRLVSSVVAMDLWMLSYLTFFRSMI